MSCPGRWSSSARSGGQRGSAGRVAASDTRDRARERPGDPRARRGRAGPHGAARRRRLQRGRILEAVSRRPRIRRSPRRSRSSSLSLAAVSRERRALSRTEAGLARGAAGGRHRDAGRRDARHARVRAGHAEQVGRGGARLAARILPALAGEMTEGGAGRRWSGRPRRPGASRSARRPALRRRDRRRARRGTALTLSGAANLRALLELRRRAAPRVETEAALSQACAGVAGHAVLGAPGAARPLAALDRGASPEELRALTSSCSPGTSPTPALRDRAAGARGALLLALGEPQPALDSLRELGSGTTPGRPAPPWFSGARGPRSRVAARRRG